MLGRVNETYRQVRNRLKLVGEAALIVGLLSGCSTVPDYVNPVEWYKGTVAMFSGDDAPEPAKPGTPKGERPDASSTPDTRKDVAKGLPSDRSNAKYAEPVRREATPTKTLARSAPAAESQTAAAVPPKPTVVAQSLPETSATAGSANRLNPDQRTATARDEQTIVPPAALNGQPPAAANLPTNVYGNQPRLKPVQEQYQRRLAESAQQTIQAGYGDPAASSYRRGEEEPIHLVPPPSMRGKGTGGKGMAAPQPDYAPQASTFQVAAVDLQFGAGRMTATERQAIADVARLHKKNGGMVRILGLGEDGFDGANSVAAELVRNGVPAKKILVGSDYGQGGALIYLDL